MIDEDGGIPESHRRGISATLGLLSQALAQFRRWAEGEAATSALFAEKNNLNPLQQTVILTAIGQVEAELLDLRQTLELTGKELDVADTITVQCAFLWEDLEDLKGRPLRRFGELSTGWAAFMDERMERLSQLLGKIASTARGEGLPKEETGGESG